MSTSRSPSSSVSVSGREVSVEGGDGRVVVLGPGARGRSQTGRAMTVPLRSRLGIMTDPVGVPEPKGVVAAEGSVDISVSLPVVDRRRL